VLSCLSRGEGTKHLHKAEPERYPVGSKKNKTKPNTMAKSVSLVYGRDSINKQVNDNATIGELATKANLTFLGAPTDNIRFTVFGDVVESSYILNEGDEVYVEAKPHSKA